MDDAHILEELDEYLDGELPAGARERVRAHLAACGDCRAEESLRRRLGGWLASVRPPESPDLAERVMARLEAEAPRRADPFRWLVPALGLAAAAAMLVLFTPGGARDVTAADLLLAEGEAAVRWADRADAPEAEDMLSLMVDEEDI